MWPRGFNAVVPAVVALDCGTPTGAGAWAGAGAWGRTPGEVARSVERTSFSRPKVRESQPELPGVACVVGETASPLPGEEIPAPGLRCASSCSRHRLSIKVDTMHKKHSISIQYTGIRRHGSKK